MDLADPEKYFDALEKDSPVTKLDRKKTLIEMERLYEKLDQKMPENIAMLAPLGLEESKDYSGKIFYSTVGELYFEKITAMNEGTIDSCKSELVNGLKDFGDRPLSLDVSEIFSQIDNLYSTVQNIDCDIILEYPQNWKKRLFR